MASFTFTIPGNHKNPKGNPVPYTRTTQGSKFSPSAMNYAKWKEYVKGCFLAYCVDEKLINLQEFKKYLYLLPDAKPIRATKQKVRMDLMITFVDDTHCDSDNCFKGVADALFQNDKYVAGSFDYQYGDKGKVEVTITML